MNATARRSWQRGKAHAAPSARKCRPTLEALEARDLPSFGSPVSYTVGTQPSPNPGNVSADGVATGDFNGDGKSDLAVVHSADRTLNVLLNKGDGTFQPPVSYSVGNLSGGPIWVSVADFNGDGKLDLAVLGTANSSNLEGGVDIFLGNGDGTFQPPQAYDTGPVSRGGLAVGDFNGDGKPDLAVADFGSINSTQSAVDVLLNNGDGTFRPRTVVPVPLAARSVTAGDFNGDGKTDLAVCDGEGYNGQLNNGDPAGVTILLGNGDGTFTTAGQYPTPPTPGGGTVNPEFITSGDLNGDGRADLVVSLYDHNIDVLLGNGDGTFRPAVGVNTWIDSTNDFAWYPRYVAVVDVNGDGINDLVVDNTGTSPNANPSWFGSVAVLLGNGDGTFQAPLQYTPFDYPGWLAVADFNGDGRPDLAVTRIQDGHSVNVMFNIPDWNQSGPYIQALYQDDLGRSAAPAEVAGWESVLSQSGREAVARGIDFSAEARIRLVQGWYLRFLGRPTPPGEGEIQGWVQSLLAGATEESVLSAILASAEFANRAQNLVPSGTSNQRYVEALYMLLLGRTPGQGEVAGWVSQLPALGRLGIALRFLESVEYRDLVVDSYYTDLLGRSQPPASSEVAGWVFSGLDLGTIRLGFEASEEFFLDA